jgi:hypothetical protein
MSLNAEFPAQSHLKIDNKWLTDYQNANNAYVDVRDLDGTNKGRRQRPRGILIGRTYNDTTASMSVVKGVLWDENHNQADTYTLANGVVHPMAFKFIYASSTTGRDIKIFG